LEAKTSYQSIHGYRHFSANFLPIGAFILTMYHYTGNKIDSNPLISLCSSFPD
jgi:hypothetical protein